MSELAFALDKNFKEQVINIVNKQLQPYEKFTAFEASGRGIAEYGFIIYNDPNIILEYIFESADGTQEVIDLNVPLGLYSGVTKNVSFLGDITVYDPIDNIYAIQFPSSNRAFTRGFKAYVINPNPYQVTIIRYDARIWLYSPSGTSIEIVK